jgi:hypothetical protein
MDKVRKPTNSDTPSSEPFRIYLKIAYYAVRYRQSYFTTDGLPPISSSWWQPLETHDQQLFLLNTSGNSPYITSPLTRGWVCRLQLMLVLASAVILRSESRGTHNHILLSHMRDSPNLEAQIHVIISPTHRVPFSSPPTTPRATVEVFDSASTQAQLSPRHWVFFSIR